MYYLSFQQKHDVTVSDHSPYSPDLPPARYLHVTILKKICPENAMKEVKIVGNKSILETFLMVSLNFWENLINYFEANCIQIRMILSTYEC